MSLIRSLWRLQTIDQEWDAKAKHYQDIRQEIADASELEQRRQALRQLAEKLSVMRGGLRDGELELASLQEKAKQVDADLYGGRVTSSKELENLRRDEEQVKKRISKLEDQVLVAMTTVDDLEASVARDNEELLVFEEKRSIRHKALVVQYGELRTPLQQLKTDREKLRSELGRAELSLYDELRRTKGGVALAPVRDGVCQVCRVTVPSHKVRIAEKGDAVATCEGCGRILCQG